MGLNKVKPKVGLLVVIPVVVGMLVFGIYSWPSGKSSTEIMKRVKEMKDSVKASEVPEEFK